MRSIHDFLKMKKAGEKIAMITCYDYTSALIVANTTIDCVLVGDSSSMVMHGAPNTTFSTVVQIATHTHAVSKGIQHQFIIADLPFMSYHKSKEKTLEAVEAFVRAGAHAVKLEGASAQSIESIHAIISTGVPVMGHLGLTPQHVHQLGGFKVQGKTKEAAKHLIEQAKNLEAAGCFCIVLECIPAALAEQITQHLSIPTIGIGAGPGTDGQVLVFHDLLGLEKKLTPTFVKRYLEGEALFTKSIEQYVQDVKSHQFPEPIHTYWGESIETH